MTRMTSDREQKLESLGYPLDRTTPEGKLVEALVIDGETVYASGQVTFDGEKLVSKGKVPSQVPVEEATRMAALCAANVLRLIRQEVGSLDRVERMLKVVGFVNSDPDFIEQHLVINGASDLLHEIFGKQTDGYHARSALGFVSLPTGAAVEVEAVFEVKS